MFVLMGCVRAHRAANPEKYPVSDAVKKLYPAYEGIESRMKPTTVHLQIYDGTHWVLVPFCRHGLILC